MIARNFSNWSIRAQVLSGPSILVLLVALVLAVSAFTAWRVDAANRDVAHNYETLDQSAELLRLIVDMETGLRGYSLTSDRAFLEPYEAARTRLPDQFIAIRRLVRDSPEQLERLGNVQAILADWRRNVAEEQIQLVQQGEDPSALVRSGEGKRRLDAIRVLVASFEVTEEEQLQQRLAEAERVHRTAQLLFVASLVAALFAFVLAASAAQRCVAPVQTLALAAQQIGEGNLAARVPEGGQNELGRTGVTFNRMATTLANARDETVAKNLQLAEQAEATERARTELDAVLNSVSDAIILLSPNGAPRLLNHRFQEFFNIGAEEALQLNRKGVRERIEQTFADPALFRNLVMTNLRNGEAQLSAIVTQRWPESRELALFSTPVQNTNGENLGRLYVYRDVTREREVDRMKTEFVSLVSHELRTPLTSIKGYVELLLEGEVGVLTGDQCEFLDIIRNNADRLIALINDLLDVSRIEAGRIELHRAITDMDVLIRRVGQTLQPQIQSKNQQLTLDLDPTLPSVWADADRITQVVINLLSNAHKYTPEGGALRIAARLDAPGNQIRVDVQDNGFGLSPENQAQLFTKFFRVHSRETETIGGTGLGLSITRSLVEMHGGTIYVSSAPGKGSTFSFTLPLTPAAVSDAPEAAPPVLAQAQPSSDGNCILVVEDEPDIAGLLQRYLERGGYEVLVASTGEQALDLARTRQPQLITLDVLLPDMNGFAVLDELKNDPTTLSIPVMLVSSLPDEGQSRMVGAVDYLPKPIIETKLLDRVHLILGRQEVGTVLVAEDDPDIRRLLIDLLRHYGYEVMEAADGEQAMNLVRQRRPDLAFLDIRMPHMDGVEVLKALRANPDTATLPVVMMTNTSGALESHRSFVALMGGTTLLTKPSTAEELASAITRSLADSHLFLEGMKDKG